MNLTRLARETIHGYGVTIAGYVREQGYENGWGGDRCGCPDDRCIGFHHDDETDCGCLGVLLDQYANRLRGEATAPVEQLVDEHRASFSRVLPMRGQFRECNG